jgi:hypothetical protein
MQNKLLKLSTIEKGTHLQQEADNYIKVYHPPNI